MQQSVLIAPQHSRLKERPTPTVGPMDVLVRVRACGICASESHGWLGDGGRYPREYGHEVAGDVVEVGAEVKDFRPGMAVTGLFQKGFAEYAVTPQTHVTPMPAGYGYDIALGEPLSCVISGARRTPIDLGDTVAIVGAGFMGLLALQVTRLKGASRVIVIDPRQEALATARRYGADETLTPDEVNQNEKMRMMDISQVGLGYGVDVVIEASGTQAGLTLAGQMVREHGFLSVVGYHADGLRQVDMALWNMKAMVMLNAHERRADYQMDCMRRGLRLMAAGRLDVASLITHRFNLSQVDDAFRALMTKPAGFIKAIIC